MPEYFPTEYPHIVKNAQGRAYVQGTDYAVDRIVQVMTPRMTSQRLANRFMNLSPAQLHAALLYYYDHQEEVDGLQAKRRNAAASSPSPGAQSVVQQKLTEEWKRLMAKGALPRTKPPQAQD